MRPAAIVLILVVIHYRSSPESVRAPVWMRVLKGWGASAPELIDLLT